MIPSSSSRRIWILVSIIAPIYPLRVFPSFYFYTVKIITYRPRKLHLKPYLTPYMKINSNYNDPKRSFTSNWNYREIIIKMAS